MNSKLPPQMPGEGGTPFFVARQPIYDAAERIWGYELLFRASAEATSAEVEEADVATASVIADGFSLAFAGVDNSTKAFINFPQKLLLDGSVEALPSDICVVEVLESVIPGPEIVAALSGLKSRGYLLALDDYVGQPVFEGILPLMDIVKVDMLATGRDRLPGLALSLRRGGRRLLAEKIEERAAYDLAKTLGFSFFQGYYFSRPETMTGSKVSAPVLAKLRLLQALSRPEFDMREISRIISTDASVSYRLLKFINSAAFSQGGRIKSIRQALSLLGTLQIKRWALAVIISDFDSTARIQEAAYLSLQRARYLENLGRQSAGRVPSAETLFLLGLFSKLDVLFGQPMDRLLKNVSLDKEVEDALLSRSSVYGGWLALVTAIESADWENARRFLNAHGLEWCTAAGCYAESIRWTQMVLRLRP